MESAQELADAFTSDPFESAARLAFSRARTSNLCSTERFSRLMNALAEPLLDSNEVVGDYADRILTISDNHAEARERTA